MGKYKQWLHHQEIGRRLRDQINTLEQERARVQKMAPSHSTSLPDLENPIIASLLAYTRAGNRLSNIDVIKAAMPKIDPVLERGRPASNAASTGTPGVAAAPASPNAAVVAGLQARAASIPADPLEQMRELARGGQPAAPAPAVRPAPVPPAGPPSGQQAQRAGGPVQGNPPAGGAAKPDSVGGWWQRQRSED
jgi:hypothetical protein